MPKKAKSKKSKKKSMAQSIMDIVRHNRYLRDKEEVAGNRKAAVVESGKHKPEKYKPNYLDD